MKTLVKFFEEHGYLNDEMSIWIGNEGAAGNAEGYFIYDHCGIDKLREELPDCKVYAFRHSDYDDANPATLEINEVVVNFFGYFVTDTDLDTAFAHKDWQEVYDWDYDTWSMGK